jgi:hypothetical protein
MDEHYENRWHLDKRVPLALIIAITAQTAAGIWFMSKLDSRVASLEETRQANAPQSDRLTRVEVRLEGVQYGIEEIKRLIRKEP